MIRTIRAKIVPTLLLALALPAGAAAQGFDIEGKYDLIKPPQPTTTPDKIEVVDVFWFGCPHCYTFLPVIERYAESKPDYVEVVRMPAIFRASWEVHARAYYTAKVLGVEDKLHVAVFKAIHDDRNRLDTEKAVKAFFEDHGVSGDDFDKAYRSFAVESGVKRSTVMQRRYGVRGTPSVVVNGKYLVTGQKAGSYGNMVKVIEALVDKERKSSAQ